MNTYSRENYYWFIIFGIFRGHCSFYIRKKLNTGRKPFKLQEKFSGWICKLSSFAKKLKLAKLESKKHTNRLMHFFSYIC